MNTLWQDAGVRKAKEILFERTVLIDAQTALSLGLGMAVVVAVESLFWFRDAMTMVVWVQSTACTPATSTWKKPADTVKRWPRATRFIWR